jgi:hypothetical protein
MILDFTKTPLKRDASLVTTFEKIAKQYGQRIEKDNLDKTKYPALLTSFPNFADKSKKVIDYFTVKTSYSLTVHLSYELAPEKVELNVIGSNNNIYKTNEPLALDIDDNHIYVNSVYKVPELEGFSNGKEIMRFVEDFVNYFKPRIVSIYDAATVKCGKKSEMYELPLSMFRFLTKDDVTTSWYNSFGEFKSTTFDPKPYQYTKIKDIYSFIEKLYANRENKKVNIVNYFPSDNTISVKRMESRRIDVVNIKKLLNDLVPFLNMTVRQTLEKAECPVQSRLTKYLADNRIYAVIDNEGKPIAAFPDHDKWMKLFRYIGGMRYWYYKSLR